jgi:hypothetical protein
MHSLLTPTTTPYNLLADKMVTTLPFQDLQVTAPGFGYVPLTIPHRTLR